MVALALSNNRSIRVFVSSTFRDMREEREELVKRVFPELRKLCEARGVVWSEVDLRWGVTDEQKAEGGVLPICLAEIERCRPYFIGLLGERYGPPVRSVPLPPNLLAREPTLAGELEHSLTELEILHAVLRDPTLAEHAFFYFRDPAYLDHLPTVANPADFRSENEEQAALLRSLKERIRASGLPVRENYNDPQGLSELVLTDFTALINRLFPEGSNPEPLDREAAEHAVFAESRARVYIRRQRYFERLDEHAAGNGPPLVVLGESGLGKSALLANWALHYRAAHPDQLVLMHFIGASAGSADWAAMVRRFMGEFQRQLGISPEEKVPEEPDALRLAFANALSMAAAKGRVVLVVDGLNQLEEHDQASDLIWLPPVVPDNTRLVLSALPGRALDDLTRRGWPTIQVEPLEVDERKRLIAEYLKEHTKTLSISLTELIASAPATANPLYLRALIEELRVWGEHDTLETRIRNYLSATSIDGLYEKILARYEQDYERERPGLVGDAMSLIWAARRGLSEAELADLLGSNGQPLPRASLSPLYLAAEQSLVNRLGLIGFFHEYLREAVHNRYLVDEAKRRDLHLRLADYFASRAWPARRVVGELPWQLSQAQEWQRLYDLLADLPFFGAAYPLANFELKGYWAQIEANSRLRAIDAYHAILDDPTPEQVRYIWPVLDFLQVTGHSTEAFSLGQYLVKHYRQENTSHPQENGLLQLSLALSSQGKNLQARGDLDGALTLLKEAERICRELDNKQVLSVSLGNLAGILYARGDLSGAMALYKEAECICQNLADRNGLQRSLNGKAVILFARGDLDGAMALHKEQERICRELGDRESLQHSLGNQAGILYARGDFDGAMALYEEAEHKCRELGYREGLQNWIGNQAGILRARGDRSGALSLLREQQNICRNIGNNKGLQDSLRNQGGILAVDGDLDGAMALYKEAERICHDLYDRESLQRSFGGQALILQTRGDLDGAKTLFTKAEHICREIGNKDGLQASLASQGLILEALGDLDSAMELLREAEQICRELGNKNGIQASLGSQARILIGRGNLDQAMPLLKEQEVICRDLANSADLHASLRMQIQVLWQEAMMLYNGGYLLGAMMLLKEQEGHCRELDDKASLSRSLGKQGLIFRVSGNDNAALALFTEEEHLCRDLGDNAGLAAALGSQGQILQARDECDSAMALYKEAERLCCELGDKDGLSRLLCCEALVFERQGRLREAFLLLEESYEIASKYGFAHEQTIKTALDRARSQVAPKRSLLDRMLGRMAK